MQMGFSRQPRFPAVILLALLIWGFHVGLWLVLYGPQVTYDSSKYLDGARSYQAGRGFVVRPYSNLGGQLWEPTRTHPPGFSLLVCAVMRLGFSAYFSSIVVLLLSGVAIFLTLGRVFFLLRIPPWLSLAALCALASMPAFIKIFVTIWSEAPSLAISLAALVCAAHWSQRFRRDQLWLLAAGLLAGFGYCLRNSSLALIAMLFIFVVLHATWRRPADVARSLAVLCVGLLGGAGWLLVDNFRVFGTVSPYDMPPAAVSAATNLDRTLQVIWNDFTAFPFLSSLLHVHLGGNVALVLQLLVAGIFVGLVLRGIRKWQVGVGRIRSEFPAVLAKHRLAILLAGFCLAALALTIAAASVFRMDAINSRFVVNIYWAPWLCIAAIAAGRSSRALRRATIILLIISCPVQFLAQARELRWAVGQREVRAEKIVFAQEVAGQAPENQFILSDNVDFLRVYGRLAGVNFTRDTSLEDILTAGQAGRLWGIVIWNREDLASGKLGSLAKELVLSPEKFTQLEVVSSSQQRLVLRWIRSEVAR